MQLTISPDDLKPIIERVAAELLDRFGRPDRISYPEPEAAELLGVKQNVLRDARLRGEIEGAKIGRGYSYTRADLVAFVEARKHDEANGHD